jgi:MipA family protein
MSGQDNVPARKGLWAMPVLLALVVLSTAARGAELPQWEAGIGISALTIPDYRGADQSQFYVFPIPYLIYRGDVLKVDRRAVRGVFFKSERLEVDTSFSGSPPVRSGRNGARQGMPDLDPLFEAGPSLKYLLLRSAGGELRVDLQFPLRAVFVTDFSYLRYSGLVFNPRISLDWSRSGPEERLSAGVALGPLFTDSRNSRLFYEVDPIYATPVRPAYEAHGGYGGMQLALAATMRRGSIWIGAFSRIDNLQGARFEDSPLVKARWSVMTGLALSWVFGSSEAMAQAEE